MDSTCKRACSSQTRDSDLVCQIRSVPWDNRRESLCVKTSQYLFVRSRLLLGAAELCNNSAVLKRAILVFRIQAAGRRAGLQHGATA